MPLSSKEAVQKYGKVSHAKDVGLEESSDKKIIEYSTKNKSILITKDLDFGNILFYPIDSHFGVIVLRLPFYFTAKQINKVLEEFLSSVSLEELKERATIVELGRYRIKK